MTTDAPRIVLIHALEESVAPIRQAFADQWPQARCFDLLDTSLAPDRAQAGTLDEAMFDRFSTLAAYAAGSQGVGGATRALLFTCSAFGAAIDAVKGQVDMPVLRPNEAAFEAALTLGSRIGLIVSFEPSLGALEAELHEMAGARGKSVTVSGVMVEGAMAALKAGDGARHDDLVAEAAKGLPEIDVLVLGQFSMARAASRVQGVVSCPVLTTPAAAVDKLRQLLGVGPA